MSSTEASDSSQKKSLRKKSPTQFGYSVKFREMTKSISEFDRVVREHHNDFDVHPYGTDVCP